MKVSNKTIIACTAAAVLTSVVGVNATPLAFAAKAITINATLSQPNQPVAGLQGWPYNVNLWYPDESPENLITETKVINYRAGIVDMGSSINEAAVKNAAEVLNTSGKMVVIGLSQGAAGAEHSIVIIMADPNRPADDDLIFVMVGSPYAENGVGTLNPGGTIPFIGVKFLEERPDSGYQTVYVSKEFGYFEDQPNRYGLMSWLNNLAGFGTHIDYTGVNMYAADNLIKVDGNRTYIIVPTKRLPMLGGLYGAAEAWKRLTGQTGFLKEVERMDVQLRAEINKDYDREGYVPIGSYVPPQQEGPSTAVVTEVPDSVSASLQGESPAESQSRFVSLDVSSDESAPLATSDGVEAVTPPPVTEEIVVDEVVEQEPEVIAPEPAQPTTPTPESTPVSEVSSETNDEAPMAEVAKEETKVEVRKKPGSGIKLRTVRDHRTPRPAAKTDASSNSGTKVSSSSSSGDSE